ncbi:MAG: FAD-dependent oxidoreductase [Paracoccaceae bacterium]
MAPARSFARAHAIRNARGWRVVLDTGQTLDAEYVVLAAGAWSGRLLRPLGIRLPITAERGYNLEFEGVATLTRPLCPTTYRFYFTPMDRRLQVAGTVELGGIGAPPSPHRWDRLLAGARSTPSTCPNPAAAGWGCAVDPGMACTDDRRGQPA